MSDTDQDALLAKAQRDIFDLIEVMARLRDPKSGCPWDIEQDFKSIAPYTIEEAYEVADAIAREDMAALKDELGDLLLQVVYHARMAEEAGLFAFDEVANAIAAKMIRRHPHVFGDAVVDSAEAQTASWEAIKATERADKHDQDGKSGPPSVLDDVPAALPALKRAEKLQKRAARVGFDWPDANQVMDKIREEISELEEVLEDAESADKSRLEDEIGDLLFAVVNLARKTGIEPGTALRGTNLKFERRFRFIEAKLAAEGRRPAESSLDDMEALWQQAKTDETR